MKKAIVLIILSLLFTACSSGGGGGGSSSGNANNSTGPATPVPGPEGSNGQPVTPSLGYLTSSGKLSGNYKVKIGVQNLSTGVQSGHYMVYGGVVK